MPVQVIEFVDPTARKKGKKRQRREGDGDADGEDSRHRKEFQAMYRDVMDVGASGQSKRERKAYEPVQPISPAALRQSELATIIAGSEDVATETQRPAQIRYPRINCSDQRSRPTCQHCCQISSQTSIGLPLSTFHTPANPTSHRPPYAHSASRDTQAAQA